MNKTLIEWVKNPDGTQGYTWNPITGCLNGCEYCYARKLANGRLRSRYLANKNYAPDVCGKLCIPDFDPFYPRFWPEKLEQPMVKAVIRNRTTIINFPKVKGIFVCDMSDLFGQGIPEEWTRKVLDVIENSPHRFYLLTKQPQNLIKWSPFPQNCWVGATATDGIAYREAIHHLYRIEAKRKFISFEPLLQPAGVTDLGLGVLDWVIIGAQTKPYKPPKIEWVREICEATTNAKIPVFLKDNLRPLLCNEQGWTPAWAVSARSCDGTEYLRQELPSIHNNHNAPVVTNLAGVENDENGRE